MNKKVRISEHQYRSLFEEQVSVSYDNPLSIDMCSENLNEGLIKTYPFETMMRYVMEYFNIPRFYMHDYENNGVKCIAIDLPKNERFQERVDKAMNLCEYFESIRMSMDGLDRIHYEPKFEEEEQEIDDILYHVTHHSNKDKIKRIGLCPYSKNILFNYPSRVYFLKGDTPTSEIVNSAKALNNYATRDFNDGIYSILKIDVNKLPKNIKFFNDQNHKYGLYTLNNIPPNCIIDDGEVVNVK
jgi:hypothetical protein